MAEPINDGGPAFPVADFDHQTFAPKTLAEARRLLSGMSLLDHFAGQALQGMLAMSPVIDGGAFSARRDADTLADCAYGLAEAMIRRRAAAALATEKAQ